MMPLTNYIKGNDISLNERKAATTPELGLAGISYDMDPTIQAATTSELEWGSAVRHWGKTLPNHNFSDVMNSVMVSNDLIYELGHGI